MSKSGSENLALEFRDLQATTMSLDRGGQFALLAGRKYLTVVGLNSTETKQPGEVVVRIPFGGKYEISNTQWSHLKNKSMVAVASSQRCDIFELTDSAELKCIYRLKCHTRVITDLDWSYVTPSLLATSSFDNFVHIWDVRCPRDAVTEKPIVSLSALDGASQVRWNRWKMDTLASCDGGHVKIWDIRRPNTPSEYIAAHASKINGLEWITKDVVVTSAQDCTVKFNRVAVLTPAKAKGPCLTLSAPVWRARPCPFGRGIVTQCVPILRRDSGLLSLWDWKRFSSPIYTFQAHDIVEFGWKTSGNCELLTWSRDQTLRIWSLPREVIELCGENVWPPNQSEVNATTDDDLSLDPFDKNDLSLKISPKKEGSLERRSKKSVSQLTKRDHVLQDEFETISETMPDNVSFEQQEVERGLLRFSWKPEPKGRVACVVLASFPVNYPSAAPTFLITSAINEVDKNQLVKNLKHTAQQCMRKSEPCLNSCINQFAEFMNQIKRLEEPDNLFRFPSRGVSNVPFPRTSGARFCFVGVLVCFGRPTYLRRVKSSDAGTPRSLSALGPFLSQVAPDDNSLKGRRLRRGGPVGEKKRAGLVTIVDVSMLLPLNKEFAGNYNHISDWHKRKTACLENSLIANTFKKISVAHAWQAAAVVSGFTGVPSPYTNGPHEQAMITCDNADDDEDTNWVTYHPLGGEMLQSMISHYADVGDVQTAATVACHFTVFDESSCARGTFQEYNCNHHFGTSTIDPTTIPQFNGKGIQPTRPGLGSPYHTVHGSDTLHGVVVNPLSDNFFRPHHRSNSWSDSLDDNKAINALMLNSQNGSNGFGSTGLVTAKHGGKFGSQRGVILDPNFHRIFDSYKKSYAEILYRWGFLQERAEIVKCLTEGNESTFLIRSGVDHLILCKTCKQRVKGPQCPSCKKVLSMCSICHIPAKGLCTYCPACGHGGHSEHMLQWFQLRSQCPTGCGCSCIQSKS